MAGRSIANFLRWLFLLPGEGRRNQRWSGLQAGPPGGKQIQLALPQTAGPSNNLLSLADYISVREDHRGFWDSPLWPCLKRRGLLVILISLAEYLSVREIHREFLISPFVEGREDLPSSKPTVSTDRTIVNSWLAFPTKSLVLRLHNPPSL